MASNNNHDPTGADTRFYRVTLLLAVTPQAAMHYDDPEMAALDTLLLGAEELCNGVQVVGEPQLQELRMTLAAAATVKAVAAECTVPADEDSIVEALATEAPKPQRKTKKHKRKQYAPRKPEVAQRLQHVFETLCELGDSATADEIAVLANVPVKQVYYDLANLHKQKRVSAHKAAGKVTWFATQPSTPQDNTNQESK